MSTKQKETWKPVRFFENKYMVSDLGRVKSIKHHYVLRPRILRPVERFGYLFCSLGKNNQRAISRLVADAFVPNTYDKPQVNHIDCNKKNNKAKNLEWVTCQENIIHAIKNGLTHNPKGEQHYRAKLNNKIIKEIRSMGGKVTQAKIAKGLGVDPSLISRILSLKYWKHV